MRCDECGREVQVAFMCPICKKFFCKDHISRDLHKCVFYPSMRNFRSKGALEENVSVFGLERIRRTIVFVLLSLITADQLLRIAARFSYSLALEANFYAVLISLFTNSFVSPLILLFSLIIPLFLLEREAVKLLNERRAGKRRVYVYYLVAFIIYFTIAIILIPGILNWVVLLL